MDKGRCLGLIGGLGVGATNHYYKELAEAHQKSGLALDLAMVHAETSRIFEHVQADDRDGLAEYLAGFISRLKAAGAELAVIRAVTPHFCVRELIGISPLPVLNIFEPLRAELSERSIHNQYVELALRGKPAEGQHAALTDLAEKLCKRDRLDAIILAGTDFSLLFNAANTKFPHTDCAALHLRAIMSV